jgi:A/G-specific adenine glycosylase
MTPKTKKNIKNLQKIVWEFYVEHGRHDLTWRKNPKPYYVLVSEVMLQQTQVPRVRVKFAEFIKVFPTIKSLAKSDQVTLLRTWKGLGYNRRALWLRDAAQTIVSHFGSRVPRDPKILESLKGIGHYTARAIATFSYNDPHAFIETNIRRIFIHHFYSTSEQVPDSVLLPLIEVAVDQSRPREWYWALMDYGSYLGKAFPNANTRSKHYAKQSKFEGSDRQVRSKIMECMMDQQKAKLPDLIAYVDDSPDRVERIAGDLVREGFLVRSRGIYRLYT